MRRVKLGQLEYHRRGKVFHIYKIDKIMGEGNYSASYIGKSFNEIEEARLYVWKENGWGEPKSRLS